MGAAGLGREAEASYSHIQSVSHHGDEGSTRCPEAAMFAHFASNLPVRDGKMNLHNFEITEIWLLEM